MLRTQAAKEKRGTPEQLFPSYQSLLHGYTLVTTGPNVEIATALKMPQSVNNAQFGLAYERGDPSNPHMRYVTAW